MRTETINIYTFDELSDSAKETARQWHKSDIDWHGVDEWVRSMRAFCGKFPIEVVDFSICPFSQTEFSCEYTSNKIDYNLSGEELYEYLDRVFGEQYIKEQKDGACSLTGFCGDASLFDPLFEFMENPNEVSYKQLLKMCIAKWHKDCEKDLESQTTNEYIDTHIIANQYEFTEDGNYYS